MTDRFETISPSIAGPASHAFAVTPSDSSLLPETTRGIYVGAGGNIAALTLSGANITLTAVPGGSLLPLRLTKIMATGTTATSILGLV